VNLVKRILRPTVVDSTQLTYQQIILVIIGIAFVIRVAVILFHFSLWYPWMGDSNYYIQIARDPRVLGIPAAPLAPVKTVGPIYPTFLIPFFYASPSTLEALTSRVIAVRLVQLLMDTWITCMMVQIAWRLFGERVALITTVVQAFDLRYIFISATISTETLFIALFVTALWALLKAQSEAGYPWYRISGGILGLAVLTRPIPILFPLLLIAVLLPAMRRFRRELTGLVNLFAVMLLIITPWFARTAIVTGEAVPVVSTAFNHFWMSTQPGLDDSSTEDIQNRRAEEGLMDEQARTSGNVYVSAGVRNILRDPLPWVWDTLRRTGLAFLRPYGTIFAVQEDSPDFGTTLQSVLHGEAPLPALLSISGFWERLLMYLWHGWGVVFGLAGIALLLAQRKMQPAFPLLAWILYGTAVSAALLIEPRYVFPLMFAFTIFAAYASLSAWDWLCQSRARGLSAPAPVPPAA